MTYLCMDRVEAADTLVSAARLCVFLSMAALEQVAEMEFALKFSKCAVTFTKYVHNMTNN